MARYELNLHGTICPDPLIATQNELEKLAPGDELLVKVDYPLAAENIPRWAQGAGHAVTVAKTGGSTWEILIRKA
ncbi:MAG: sulfurtransferase TusA family protein [Nitrospinota bacterium]